ncbi:MAG: DRTGG domain-containing protein [Oscillospiraceae bacterium]|nr:DRTGG domain-containing protein [Oscillospiraceae bacterium]MDD4413594.1 DRTGG domain-containing protein [Oscillospiraceae bacterium]
MTVSEIAHSLGLEILVKGKDDRKVTGGYSGDLLSWVMGRAREGDAWITIMGNINAIAVAVLADISCIILAEGSPLDQDAKERAESERIPVLGSQKTAYNLSIELERII